MNRTTKRGSNPKPSPSRITPQRRKLLMGSILVIVIILTSWFFVVSSTQRLLARASSAVEQMDFVEAERLAKLALEREPTSAEALFLAGVAVRETRGVDAALEYFQKIPDDGTAGATQALFARAEIAYSKGFARDAETLFRRIVELDPGNATAHERLIYIYAAQGRMWELSRQLLPLLQLGVADSNHLLAVASPRHLMIVDSPFVQRCLLARPADPLPRLLEAKWKIRSKHTDQAIEILKQIIRVHPEVAEAQAELGKALLDLGTPEEFIAWHEHLPRDAEEHPDIWLVRGLWSAKCEQADAAVRCFGEAVRRAPNHPAANYQLSMALAAAGQAVPAEIFVERSRRLDRLALLVDELDDMDKILRVVKLLRELGRLWEAVGWCRIATGNEAAWAKPMLDQLLFDLANQDTLAMQSSSLAIPFDLSQYALPDFKNLLLRNRPNLSVAAFDSRVRFSEVSAQVGLVFSYFNGAAGNNSESLFELDGGGVGALDYDLDGWPDLYLTQGGPLPRRGAPSPHHYQDRLFRNQDGKNFADITTASRLDNKLYSQGLAVGDFDADGFPDLYIANIGTNVLYRNNGDGTFQEVSASSGAQGDVWTSSCLMADLNGDAFPDIYAVNYIGGDELFTHECRIDAFPRCAPLEYPAEQDRLYMNVGDGTFKDVTEQSGIIAPEGRGLGIVAADFHGSHRLSLFVANDMSPNFFFQNQTASPGEELRFVERAVLNGLAYNSAGRSQACMGVAAGDANQDGLLDLFVTNFYRDSNCVYVQLPDGSFRDDIAASQLQQATYPVLGWGTQFLDAELDGILDLIVTNGHVHDPWDDSVPYQMQPQFFRGRGQGRFDELPSEQLGSYFQGKYLGRAMARLDWNRDGKEDVCIGHLNSPVALLNNETVTPGHWLSLTLVGVNTSRDAIGTVIRITSGNRTSVQQLTAGDGFQCSNERRLVFGLGSVEVIDEIKVQWLSGLEQTFTGIQSNQELIIVEGNASVFLRH